MDTVEKLSISQIKGFESFDVFLTKNFSDFKFTAENFKDLQEMEKLYKEKQLWVLEKILNFNYFQKDNISMDIELQNRSNLILESLRSAQTEMHDKDYDANRNSVDNGNNDQVKFHFDDGIYQGREKKLISIKLTKFINNHTDFSQTEKKNTALLQQMTDDYIFKLTDVEIEKINKSKNHKTYYDEQEIRVQFETIKQGLIDINNQIVRNPEFSYENLTDEQLELLINASSFSLNSIHFKKKFDKSDYLICPNDVIYVINKLKKS
jgi:hypothetical protein